MITKLIGVATLFTAGSLMAAGSHAVGATSVSTLGADAALSLAGNCSSSAKDAKDAKEEGKAPAKAKDGSCGKGTCGSKDVKKAKAKDGSCSKDMKKGKKDGSCGKDMKEGSCGKDKK